MMSIQIDSEVFAYLQQHSKPLVDTPNTTLRRLLKLDINQIHRESQSSTNHNDVLDDLLAESLRLYSEKPKKAPKADLNVLVKAGLLQNGQKLYFVDYKSNRVNNLYSTVSNNRLLFNEHSYSMSDLARELLKKIGFSSESVRGPTHWVTESGLTISDLWLKHIHEKK